MQLATAVLRTMVRPVQNVLTACVCEIRPLPKKNGSAHKALISERRLAPKKGVMVRVTAETLGLWTAVGDSYLLGWKIPGFTWDRTFRSCG